MEEQGRRFEARITDPLRQWKHRLRLFFLQMPMVLTGGISDIISGISIYNVSNYMTMIFDGGTPRINMNLAE